MVGARITVGGNASIITTRIGILRYSRTRWRNTSIPLYAGALLWLRITALPLPARTCLCACLLLRAQRAPLLPRGAVCRLLPLSF